MNTLETKSARLDSANALLAKFAPHVKLLAIKQILHRAGFAGQESEHIAEVHLLVVNGVRQAVDLWFLRGKLTKVSNPRPPHVGEFPSDI